MIKELRKGQPCCFSTRADVTKKMMLIEVTNHCNLACPYCHSIPNEGGENEISDERLVAILDDCKRMQFETIVVSGGEPLVSKRLFWLADEIKKRGLKADLCTNGTLIDKEKARTLAQYFGSATVTLDTIDANVYAEMKACQPRMHERAMSAVKYLVEEGVKVGVTIVLTKYNAFEIDQVIDSMKSIGVAKIALLRLFHTNHSNEFEFDYSVENRKKIQEKMDKVEGIRINLKGWNFDTYRFAQCNAGSTTFAIDHEGYLLPCIMLREHNEGCNLKYVTLEEAMNSEYIQSIPKQIKALECDGCEYNETCNKGCPATLFSVSKKLAPDQRCMYRKGQKNYADECES